MVDMVSRSGYNSTFLDLLAAHTTDRHDDNELLQVLLLGDIAIGDSGFIACSYIGSIRSTVYYKQRCTLRKFSKPHHRQAIIIEPRE